MNNVLRIIDRVTGQPWAAVTDENYITFYDGRYMHTEYGQRTYQYYISTILEGDSGLDIDTGVPTWSISADGMAEIRAWLSISMCDYDIFYEDSFFGTAHGVSADINEALEAVLKRFNDFDYYCMGAGTIRIEKAND